MLLAVVMMLTLVGLAMLRLRNSLLVTVYGVC